jgi:predicted DNA-binding transcriptional regulator YafY
MRFTPRKPPSDDLASYVAKGVPPLCRAKVKLPLPAESASAHVPSWMGAVESGDEHGCFVNMGSSTYENVALHLMMLGIDFEVIEPPELIDQLRRLADRIGRAHSALQASSHSREGVGI